MKRSRLGLRKKLGFAAITLAVFLVAFVGLGELGIRLFVPPAMWRFRDAKFDWAPDPVLGWVNKPEMDESSRFAGKDVIRFRTNRDGLIPFDATRERVPGLSRIMIFGDSMVVGRSVPQDQIYTARLEEELRERGLEVEVINAGVQGYSTDQSLLHMERLLPIYRPDVVAFGHTLNDLGGNSTHRAYGQPKPMFVLEHGRLRLVPAEPNDQIRSSSALRSQVQRSAFYRILQPRLWAIRSKLIGVRERALLGLEHAVYADPRRLDQFDWDLLGAMLARMQRSVRVHGAEFVVFGHPEAAEDSDAYIEAISKELGIPPSRYDRHAVDKRVRAAASAAGVPYLSTIDTFHANQSRGKLHPLPYDGHLSPAGHQLMAELLADHLVERVLPRLESGEERGSHSSGRGLRSPLDLELRAGTRFLGPCPETRCGVDSAHPGSPDRDAVSPLGRRRGSVPAQFT